MPITTPQQFSDRLKELYARNVEISAAKNSDYANPTDPFANFRACEQFGIAMAEQGILVRMSDKLMRAANLLKKPAAVTDESVLDTLSDLANYSMILRMLIESKQNG